MHVTSPERALQLTGSRVPSGERVPGHNVDRVDVEAGMEMAEFFGYGSPQYQMVVEYALMRHARGEEADAERSAMSGGIDLTSWYAIKAVAILSADTAVAQAGDRRPLTEPEVTQAREMLKAVTVLSAGEWKALANVMHQPDWWRSVEGVQLVRTIEAMTSILQKLHRFLVPETEVAE